MNLTDLIPKGHYCYDIISYNDDFSLTCKYCPFFTHLQIAKVSIPYCLHEKCGSIDGNAITDKEFETLMKHFNCTEDELWEMFDGDLLWDACKLCNINNEDININYGKKV